MDIHIKKDIDFLVIVGPTAVGKTDISIDIAKKYNGEIINGDSVQVYKHLNIGSAKIPASQMQGINHHLLDVKEPYEGYTVADFKKDCEEKIVEISQKGKLPIIVGGSGLYINSVVYDYKLFNEGEDLELKKKLNLYSEEELYEIVKKKCEEEGIEISRTNRIRLVNYAYKVFKGIPLKEKLKKKNCQVLCLNMERKKLYERINKRVDIMIKAGLIDEVSHFDSLWPSQRTIGYKEVHQFLEGKIDKEQMIEDIKQNSRRFAKRQITWFKNKMEVDYIEMK